MGDWKRTFLTDVGLVSADRFERVGVVHSLEVESPQRQRANTKTSSNCFVSRSVGFIRTHFRTTVKEMTYPEFFTVNLMLC